MPYRPHPQVIRAANKHEGNGGCGTMCKCHGVPGLHVVGLHLEMTSAERVTVKGCKRQMPSQLLSLPKIVGIHAVLAA